MTRKSEKLDTFLQSSEKKGRIATFITSIEDCTESPS